MISVGYSTLVFESVDGFSILDEGTVVNDEKLMTEKGKDVISVKINGKEYRYIAKPDTGRSTKDVWKSFSGIMKHSGPNGSGFKALAYLKKNTYCYFGCKDPSLGLKVLEG